MHILRFSWNITIQHDAKCQQLLNLDTLDHKNNQAVDFAFLNIIHPLLCTVKHSCTQFAQCGVLENNALHCSDYTVTTL